MSLTEYYAHLKTMPSPSQSIIVELAGLCKRKPLAVRRWLLGQVVPDIIIQEKISDYLNIPVEELFPSNKCKTHKQTNHGKP